MNIALLGCGYVAGYYARTLGNHPGLRLVGAYDHNPDHLAGFRRHLPVRAYASREELMADPSVDLVLNLTNPRAHFATNREALEAGKHVYSEKPLAMTAAEAWQLVELARARGRHLASAPCSVLGQSAQSLWKAVRSEAVGKVRLVYANFDDGLSPATMRPWTWKNEYGAPWPARDEFEVGCTFEHAAYVLTWLAAMFGPARRVTAFASCVVPDKGIEVSAMAPDFTVGCLEYDAGIVARVTCGLAAPRNKSITVMGDEGTLFVTNVRDDYAPVMIRRPVPGGWPSRAARYLGGLRRWLEDRVPEPAVDVLSTRRWPGPRAPKGEVAAPTKRVDFMRGPAEMAAAIAEGRPGRLSAELGAHMVEVVEALQYPERFGRSRTLTTDLAPMAPMPWAV